VTNLDGTGDAVCLIMLHLHSNYSSVEFFLMLLPALSLLPVSPAIDKHFFVTFTEHLEKKTLKQAHSKSACLRRIRVFFINFRMKKILASSNYQRRPTAVGPLYSRSIGSKT
jgi:hypothetical protein